MNYIVNPVWFWLISVCSEVKTAAWLVSGCLAIAVAIMEGVLVVWRVNDPKVYEDEIKRLRKGTLIVAVCCSVVTLLAILIPSQNTATAMLIARYATRENAETAVEAVKSAVDYIINAIKAA